MLLLWLNTLSLIPFDLTSLESRSSTSSNSSLSNQFLTGVRSHLQDTGPTRELAAYCIATFLVRTDMAKQLLSDFLTWAIAQIKLEQSGSSAESSESFVGANYIYRLGVLNTVIQVLKRGDRDKIISFVPQILESVEELLSSSKRSLERKMLCKLCQRAGLVLLPPREASWRYSRGLRTLLPQSSGTATAVVVETTTVHSNETDEEEAFAIPDEVEDIVGNLLKFLVDEDTIVRWSAAKGLGRVCMRVSKLFGADIVNAVLELFDAEEQTDVVWHGACLALAELSRRGLILPEMLPNVVPFIWQALVFDSSKQQQSIGANVRDSACYVCWAFARAYPPSSMQGFIANLSRSLLITTLFDREINCRRAAAAAFQELVGRQGNQNVPYGIEIIGLADYVSIGIRKHAYLHIAPKIASFERRFRDEFVDFLLKSNLSHWDIEIRELTAKALAIILAGDNAMISTVLLELMTNAFSSDVATKHGALIGIAQVLLVSRQNAESLSADVVQEINALPTNIEKKRLFRGRGSEIVREAVCRVIESIGMVNAAVSLKSQVSYVEVLNENLRQPHASVQEAAHSALRVFLFNYFGVQGVDSVPSERLQALTTKKYIDGMKAEENVAVTRGFALALGALPPRLALVSLDEIIEVLDVYSSPEKRIIGEYDAETCRNALLSAVELSEKVSVFTAFNAARFGRVLHMMFRSGQDYNIDKRGDIGSWSRTASLEGCFRVMQAALSRSSALATAKSMLSPYGVGEILSEDDVSDGFRAIRLKFPSYSSGWLALRQFAWLGGESSSAESSLSVYVKQDLVDKNKLTGLVTAESLNSAYEDLSSLLTRCINLCLQHLSEKLDTIRNVAGGVLGRLLNLAAAHGLLEGEVLSTEQSLWRMHEEYIANTPEPINWGRPEHAFPFVIEAFVRFKKYRGSIFAGLITSVGSITESIKKAACNELLRSLTVVRGSPVDEDIAADLMQLICVQFETMKKKDRIILPLLKVVDICVKNNVFWAANPSQTTTWASTIADFLTVESKGCSQVPKLCSLMDVTSLLLDCVQQDAARFSKLTTAIFSMLGHKYPRVRKCRCFPGRFLFAYSLLMCDRMYTLDAAELLYLNVLSGKFETLGTSSSRDELGDLLTEVSWESDNVESISEGKRRAFSLIGLDYTAPAKTTNKPAAKKSAVDELDSYETLVKEAGMFRFCAFSHSRLNESALYTISQATRSAPHVM